MRIQSVEHVQLAMPAGEEAAARHFYGELLGIPEVAKPPNLATRGGCWFVRDELKVHLGVEKDFRPARKAHPAFLVSNLSDLVEHLRDAGVEIVSDEPLEGFEHVYAYDPFGNRLEFMEPTQVSPAGQ